MTQDLGACPADTGLAGAEAPEPDKPSRPSGGIPSAFIVMTEDGRFDVAADAYDDYGGEWTHFYRTTRVTRQQERRETKGIWPFRRVVTRLEDEATDEPEFVFSFANARLHWIKWPAPQTQDPDHG